MKPKPGLTVTHRIVLGYLLVALFCTVAVVFSLTALNQQTRQTEHLIFGDVSAMSLVRSMGQTLLAQQRLEKQFLLLRDPALEQMQERRDGEFRTLWQKLEGLPLPHPLPYALVDKGTAYLNALNKRSEFSATSMGPPAQGLDLDLAPQRTALLEQLELFTQERQSQIDRALTALPKHSGRAFKMTLLLTVIGIGIGSAVAVSVSIYIHRSVSSLVQTTQKIATGHYDYRAPGTTRQDEFGQLARELERMGGKLQEYDRLRLDANPLTHLPGNLAIDQELSRRIEQQIPFAHLYVDLDNFKAYNDRYGYQAGSDIIARTGQFIQQTLEEHGNDDDLLGHIGGDDYVVLTTPDRAEPLAQNLIELFDRTIGQFYSEEDRQTGHFSAHDRFGVVRRFPLMTMSIAIVGIDNLHQASPLAISRESAKLKGYLKKLPGSNYLFDRRDKR